MILARAAGEPVVVLAVIYQHSPFVLMANAESGVKDIHEMAEAAVRWSRMRQNCWHILSEGVDPKPATPAAHLRCGGPHQQVGSMSAYATDEPFYMKRAGRDYLVFTPRAEASIFTETISTRRNTKSGSIRSGVQKFVEAGRCVAGNTPWRTAGNHRPHPRDYNRGKTREQLEFEATETAKLVHPELIELGYINPGRWRIAHT